MTREPSAAAEPAPGARTVLLLALLGGAACWLLSRVPPVPAGAARMAAPETLLGLYDSTWLLCLLWPRRGQAASRAGAGLLALAVGAPFHVALAAAAGGGAGHAGAIATLTLAALFTSVVSSRRRAYAPLLGVALVALPLAAYALTDLAGLAALAGVHASPLVAPALLARRAPDVLATDSAGAAAVLLSVAVVCSLPRGRAPRVGAVLLLACVLPAVARAAPSGAEVLLGGHVREGRPLVVRVPGARRVRASDGPWAGPVGARGDEFVLLQARPEGGLLGVEIDDGAGGAVRRVDVAVRPIGASRRSVAVLDGRALGEGEIAVRPVDLPTIPEAWYLFDAVLGEPDGLAEAERRALEAFRRDRELSLPSPATMAPSPLPYRAATALAAAAPRLPHDVAAVLAIVASLIALLAVLMRQRSAHSRIGLWAGGGALCAVGWLLVSGVLPGAVLANAVVLDAGDSRLVLLRLAAVREGEVTLDASRAGGIVTPLRWGDDDAPPDGVATGARARVRLGAGRSIVLALREPVGDGLVSAETHQQALHGPLDEWIESLGMRSDGMLAEPVELPIQLDGARLLRIDRVRVSSAE